MTPRHRCKVENRPHHRKQDSSVSPYLKNIDHAFQPTPNLDPQSVLFAMGKTYI